MPDNQTSLVMFMMVTVFLILSVFAFLVYLVCDSQVIP